MTDLFVKMDIKDESNHIFTICQGCLSTDRKLKCITGLTKTLFIKLREDLVQNENDTRGILLCWECIALINKMKYFQTRIKTAQNRLIQYLQTFYGNQNIPQTLSQLKITKPIENYYNLIFIENKNELLFEQNLLSEQKDLNLEQKDILFERKEETEKERLVVDIKIERNEHIKEEYGNDNSYNNDLEYYDADFKQETDEDFSYYENTKKTYRKLKSRIQKYEEFAMITKINSKFSKNVSQYYNTVYVSPRKVEDHYREKGSNRSTKNMPFRCKMCNSAYAKRLDYLRHNTFNHIQLQYPTNCIYCKREILSETHLEDHWTKHSPMLRCTFCAELCRTKGELTKHLNRTHTKTYACNSCALEFRSISDANKENETRNSSNDDAMLTNEEPCQNVDEEPVGEEPTLTNHTVRAPPAPAPRRCRFYRTLREFSKHYIMAHERFTCDYCNKNVCSKRKLEAHIKRMHIPGHCSICNKDYPTYHLLEKHIARVHPSLVPHLSANESSEETRYCVECDKQYPTVSKYRRHLQQSVVHKGPRKKVTIPCPACDKIFSRVSYKNNHYRLVHIKESKHYCEMCNKYFANGYGVRKHILHVHQKIPKPKDKICDLCGRGFSSNRILANHRRTHTGERPFKCEYCPASFAQAYAMKTHQKTQHKNVLMSC